MKEKKFRAWDKENKTMSSEDFVAVSPNNGRFSPWSISGDGITIRNDSDRFTILQYTGLKDKNDKEIYDGDILEFPDKEKCKIEWIDHAWHLHFYEYETDFEDYLFGHEMAEKMQYLAKIGNIHENPELINAI